MKIFVQFPRKDIFSFKCKYCFNILSKAHENICALKPSPQTIFRSSSAGRLCVMQHCAWTRGDTRHWAIVFLGLLISR